jgi:hypothetical protein
MDFITMPQINNMDSYKNQLRGLQSTFENIIIGYQDITIGAV